MVHLGVLIRDRHFWRTAVTTRPAQCWHLLREPSAAEPGQAPVEKIEVPAVGAGHLPLGADPHDAAVFEAVMVSHHPYLLMLSPGEQRLRVNGQRAPRV